MAKVKKHQDTYVTRKILDEAVHTILEGVSGLFDDFKEEVTGRFGKVETGLDKVEKGLGKVETQVGHLRQDVNDLKFDTSTRKEFKNLQAKVNKYHPLS